MNDLAVVRWTGGFGLAGGILLLMEIPRRPDGGSSWSAGTCTCWEDAMSDATTPAPIVWHDLLTCHVDMAQSFYERLLGWTYRVEHAPACAWTGREADYPLIVANGQAHGGSSIPDATSRRVGCPTCAWTTWMPP